MGYYKSLLTSAQQGDKQAMKIIGQDYEAKKQIKEALKWYQSAGDSSSVNRLTKQLKASSNDKAANIRNSITP